MPDSTLKIELQHHKAGILGIHARVSENVLELSWEEFAERYARPAFEQLAAEMKYRLDHPKATA